VPKEPSHDGDRETRKEKGPRREENGLARAREKRRGEAPKTAPGNKGQQQGGEKADRQDARESVRGQTRHHKGTERHPYSDRHHMRVL